MSAAPLRGKLLTPVTVVLTMLALIAAYFVVQRLFFGLGAVTNLNQGYPWGIWVVGDVMTGTAFGCGGFAMAILVYIFNRGEYHPLVRPALLAGLFGYTLAGLAIMIDLGRWWQAYNVLLPWYMQPRSVMFEVALCMMAYVAVLWLEFSPAFLERFGLLHWKRTVERWMFVLVALGVVLPLMHQSSIGAVLLVLGPKLSPLWWTLLLPLLFVTSAIAMGYAVVMFEATVVSNSFNLPSEHALISKLSQVVGWLMAGWLVVRWADLYINGAIPYAFAMSVPVVSFWVENALFLLPVLIFLSSAGRASQSASLIGAVSLLAAGSLYRLNAYLIGYTPVGNYTYFPAVGELMVTIGFVAFEVLLYLIFIKTLPVLHGQTHARSAHA